MHEYVMHFNETTWVLNITLDIWVARHNEYDALRYEAQRARERDGWTVRDIDRKPPGLFLDLREGRDEKRFPREGETALRRIDGNIAPPGPDEVNPRLQRAGAEPCAGLVYVDRVPAIRTGNGVNARGSQVNISIIVDPGAINIFTAGSVEGNIRTIEIQIPRSTGGRA